MKVLFIFPREKAYDIASVREYPSGGTEKAVIFLGEAFQKLGHTVTWVTTLDQEPETEQDVVITQHAEFLEHFPQSKRVFWSHHFSDQPINQQQAVYARCFADKIVTLSKCHHDDLLTKLRLDSVVIGHGVWLDEVQKAEKDPYRLIYASTPFRGLERIPSLFKAIKEREPRATIAIASSMATYGTPEQDDQYRGLFADLQAIPGITLLGSLNQEQLYQEYAKAGIFFYPCIWPETYCMAMDEAIAHGCEPLVLDIGALGERVKAQPDEPMLVKGYEDKQKLNTWLNTPVLVTQQPKDWLDIAREWEEKVFDYP